jgi:5'-3' exonuclease
MKKIDSLDSTKKILIYGLDCDLVMLSLLKQNNIVLIRDNSFNSKLEDGHEKKCIDYLNINNLKNYIYKHIYDYGIYNLKNKELESFKKTNKILLINDYVLLSCFLGNDFLEHLPSVQIRKGGVDLIIKVYINSWKGSYLINENKCIKESINLNFLKDIFYQLKNHESYFFKNFKYENLANDELIILEKIQLLNQVEFYNFNDKNDLIYKGNQDDIKTKYNLFYNINQNDTCFNYIEGLYWILGYYKNHIDTHNNWNWYYKYHNVPFCSDLFEYLRKNHNKNNNLQILINNSSCLIQSPVFSNLKQLCLVLPKSSLNNILKELYPNELIKLKSLLNNKTFYPNKIFIDVINKKFLWQSKIIFSIIEENILNYYLN